MHIKKILLIATFSLFSLEAFSNGADVLAKSLKLTNKLKSGLSSLSQQDLSRIDSLLSDALKITAGRTVVPTPTPTLPNRTPHNNHSAEHDTQNLFCPSNYGYEISNLYTGKVVSTGSKYCYKVLEELESNGLFCSGNYDYEVRNAFTGSVVKTGSKYCYKFLEEARPDGLFCTSNYGYTISNVNTGAEISTGSTYCYKLLETIKPSGFFCKSNYGYEISNVFTGSTVSTGSNYCYKVLETL